MTRRIGESRLPFSAAEPREITLRSVRFGSKSRRKNTDAGVRPSSMRPSRFARQTRLIAATLVALLSAELSRYICARSLCPLRLVARSPSWKTRQRLASATLFLIRDRNSPRRSKKRPRALRLRRNANASTLFCSAYRACFPLRARQLTCAAPGPFLPSFFVWVAL